MDITIDDEFASCKTILQGAYGGLTSDTELHKKDLSTNDGQKMANFMDHLWSIS